MEIQYSKLIEYQRDLESEEWLQKHEFLKWKEWEELVKLRAIRKDLAEMSRWNLIDLSMATTTLKRRIKGLIEGKKLHSWGLCAEYDKIFYGTNNSKKSDFSYVCPLINIDELKLKKGSF